LEFLEHFRFLYDGVAFFFTAEGWKNLVMILIGGLLIYLARVKITLSAPQPGGTYCLAD